VNSQDESAAFVNTHSIICLFVAGSMPQIRQFHCTAGAAGSDWGTCQAWALTGIEQHTSAITATAGGMMARLLRQALFMIQGASRRLPTFFAVQTRESPKGKPKRGRIYFSDSKTTRRALFTGADGSSMSLASAAPVMRATLRRTHATGN